MKKSILFLLFLLILSACSSTKISNKEEKSRNAKISSFYKSWKGTKYRLGGTTKSGVDCSALMQHLYKDKFKINLPRTTEGMVLKGEKIKRRSQWEVGDLIFFRIGRKKTRHVGVYMGNNKFMHASTSRGVIISNFDGYWSKQFWQVRRVL